MRKRKLRIFLLFSKVLQLKSNHNIPSFKVYREDEGKMKYFKMKEKLHNERPHLRKEKTN